MVELLPRSDGADHLAAEGARDLDACAPDPACCRGDENPCPGTDDRLTGQRDPGGEEREEECGPLLERRAFGKVEQPAVLDDGFLGVPAAVRADEADHPPAVRRHPGDLRARDEGQRRRLWVAALADEDVRVVDTGRAHLDDGLSLGGLRLRDLAQLEPALVVQDDRLHESA